MKAVGVTEFGGPEVLHPIELPSPSAGSGQVRIRVHAASVNPADRNIRTGFWVQPPDQPPYVPGWEATGVVDQIGAQTRTDLQVGDDVMAVVVPFGTHGAYAEQVVVPVESVVRIPSGATMAEAASLPMNGLTARLALDTLELAPGQTVAVTGAVGAVGGYVVQLAKADGLRVVADAAPRDKPLAKQLGADVVLPRGADYPQRVRAEVPGGVDGLVDTAIIDRAAAVAVRDGGRVATLRGFQETAERGVTFVPVMAGDQHGYQEKLDRLRQQTEDCQITLRVAQTFPAEQAADAHRLLDAGGVRGRLILLF